MAELAVFDLDGTILAGDSFRRFLVWLYLTKDRRAANILRAVRFVAARKCRFVTHHQYKEGMLAILARRTRIQVEALGTEFFHLRGRSMIREGALKAIQDCKRQGLETVLSTATPDIYVRHFADALAFDAYHAAALDYNHSSRFTGKITGRSAFGAEKLAWIRGSERYSGNTIAIAYSDSLHDVALLAEASDPVMVHPSKALRNYGEARGWREEEWSWRFQNEVPPNG